MIVVAERRWVAQGRTPEATRAWWVEALRATFAMALAATCGGEREGRHQHQPPWLVRRQEV